MAKLEDLVEVPGGMWLILTWYRGGDLGKEIAEAKDGDLVFGIPTILSWVSQLGLALQYLP